MIVRRCASTWWSQQGAPVYGPRPLRPSQLDSFKPYLEERLKAGVWNPVVLLRELGARGCPGRYTILKDWLQPQRESAHVVAVRRFETPPGKHYGESGVMVRTWRRPAFGAGDAAREAALNAT